MGRLHGIILMLIILTFAVNLLPEGSSQNGDVEWSDEYSITDNCSSNDNVEHRFWINSTVVEIDINLSWSGGYGADINFWIEDSLGFNVVASESMNNPDLVNIREFPARGRWKIVVYPVSCGSGTQVNYTVHITVRHIVLPELSLSTHHVKESESVSMNITSPYTEITHFFIDYDDETNSGWSTLPHHTKTYNESGEYTPRAKVRYSDGTESDWVEAGTIEIDKEPEAPNIIPWVIFWLLLVGLLSFGANVAYSKRKGAKEG